MQRPQSGRCSFSPEWQRPSGSFSKSAVADLGGGRVSRRSRIAVFISPSSWRPGRAAIAGSRLPLHGAEILQLPRMSHPRIRPPAQSAADAMLPATVALFLASPSSSGSRASESCAPFWHGRCVVLASRWSLQPTWHQRLVRGAAATYDHLLRFLQTPPGTRYCPSPSVCDPPRLNWPPARRPRSIRWLVKLKRTSQQGARAQRPLDGTASRLRRIGCIARRCRTGVELYPASWPATRVPLVSLPRASPASASSRFAISQILLIAPACCPALPALRGPRVFPSRPQPRPLCPADRATPYILTRHPQFFPRNVRRGGYDDCATGGRC